MNKNQAIEMLKDIVYEVDSVFFDQYFCEGYAEPEDREHWQQGLLKAVEKHIKLED